ncbi:MAG: hypothetical protein B6226_04900, partial [Candidatus Cloacimonetes bacterium 4572_65]
MRKNQNKTWLSFMLCLLALSFSFNLFAVNADEVIVEEFRVEDVPGDLGDGLILKWKPLPNDLKILEYRVYRGLNPDSLYYLGNVVLNPAVGFSGPELTFLDKGYKPFVNKTSPGSLKRDKHIKGHDNFFGSTLKGLPRDLDILSSTNGKYAFYAQVDKPIYYSRAKEVIAEDGTFSGFPMGNIGILASVIPGVEYFYSIVPVNENRRYLSPSPVMSASPLQDPAFKPAKTFYASLVKDGTKAISLNFEWNNYPDSYSNQQAIYIFEDSVESARLSFTTENWNGVKPIIIPITSDYNKFVVNIDEKDGQCFMTGTEGEFVFDTMNMDKYSIAIVTDQGNFYFLDDNSGKKEQHVIISDVREIPAKPVFTVSDLPNDKGDTQVLIWDRPTVEITKTTFVNKLGSFLVINYDFLNNKSEEVKVIDLKLFVGNETEPFVDYNEFYLDYRIKIKLPNDYKKEQQIRAELIVTTSKKDAEPYLIEQTLDYDTIVKALVPSSIIKDGLDVEKVNYEIYSKNTSPIYSTLKTRIAGKTNSFSDVLSYEKTLYEPVVRFDVESGRILIASELPVLYDNKAEKMLVLSRYPARSKEMIIPLLVELDAEIATITEPAKRALLENYRKTITDLQETLNKGISNKAWYKIVKKYRTESLRYASYKMVATNSRGLYSEFIPALSEDGASIYYKPISNNFDNTKWPMLIATLIFGILVAVMVVLAKKGTDLYIRPIAGIQEIDNAIGRATEMGRPILFVPGMSSIGVVATLAALSILGKVAKKAAEYDTR